MLLVLLMALVPSKTVMMSLSVPFWPGAGVMVSTVFVPLALNTKFGLPVLGKSAVFVRVTLNVSLNRNVRGRDTTQPARPGASPASWVQSVTIAPRNVGTLPP